MQDALGNYPTEKNELTCTMSGVLQLNLDWILPANIGSEIIQAIHTVLRYFVRHQLMLLPNYKGYQESELSQFRTLQATA